MVLEKRMKEFLGKKGFNTTIFIIGGLLEILGFITLLSPAGLFNLMNNYRILMGMIIVIGGFLLATSVRKK